MNRSAAIAFVVIAIILCGNAEAQIGKRFPSERKVVKDPVTGTMLTFLTSTPAGDSKIYQTHNQWTSDGQWLIFRSNRVPGEAMAVNEATGEMVQVTEGGYSGMLNIARQVDEALLPAKSEFSPGPASTAFRGTNARNTSARPAAGLDGSYRGRSRKAFCRQQSRNAQVSRSLPARLREDAAGDRSRRRHGSGRR